MIHITASRKSNILNRHSGLSDHLSSSARCKKADILLNQALGQVEKTGLVVDGDNCCGLVSYNWRHVE